LLSRSPGVSDDLLERFMTQASELGFDTESLIFVEQD